MKLREIYIKCKEVYLLLYNDYKGYKNVYDETRKIVPPQLKYIINIEQDIHLCIEAKNIMLKSISGYITELSDIQLFDDLIDKILAFYVNKDTSEDTDEDYIKVINSVYELVSELLKELDTIIRLCETMGFVHKEQKQISGLKIKLPQSHSLTELKKDISDLEFIFTKCPFFQSDEEELKFQNIDIGSIWLDFFVIGAAVGTGSIILNNIVAFIDKCFVIKSHQLNTLQQKNDIEKAKMEMDEKKELFESVNRLYKFTVNNVINDLEDTLGHKLKDGEERGMTEQSIEKLMKLIDRGLQIDSTIDSPKETKALFEPLEMKYLDIANELKRLEKKDKDE